MNNGQLVRILRAEYLVDAEGLNKIQGKPFKVAELCQAIAERCPGGQKCSGRGIVDVHHRKPPSQAGAQPEGLCIQSRAALVPLAAVTIRSWRKSRK